MADKTIKATLKVDDQFSKPMNSFQKGLSDLSKNSKITGVSLKGLGAAAGATAGTIALVATAVAGAAVAVYKLADATAEMGDEVGKASQRLGVSIEFYQKMISASEHAGASMNTMSTAMRTMLRQIQAVQDGNVRMTDTFESLGVELRDTTGELRDQEDVFADVLVKLSAMENVTERNALAQVLLGRSASELAPLFNEGADAVNNYINANETAVTVTQELADESARYNDAMQTFKEQLTQVKNNALLPLVTVFADFAEELAESEIATEDFNEALFKTAEISGVVLTGIYDLMVGFDLLQKRERTTADIAEQMTRNFDDVSTESITEEINRFTEELDAAQTRLDEIFADNTRGGANAYRVEGAELEKIIEVRESLLAIYGAELQARNQITLSTRRQTQSTEDNTVVVEEANAQRVETLSLLDQFYIANESIIAIQSDVDAQQQASWEAMQQRWAEEAELKEQMAEQEQEARRGMIEESLNFSNELFSAFQQVHNSKMRAINEEYSAEVEGIKNSTMSAKKKEKELAKLEKEKKKRDEEAQKRQLAYTAIIGASNTAMVIGNQIVAITASMADPQAGGVFGRIASGAIMLGATAKYVGDVKSAQAMIPNREHGGAVRRGELYEVAENGKDELFESGGKSYLLPSQGGRVHSGGNSTSNSNVTINANFNGGDMATIEQRLPELVAKGMEMADRQGMMDYGGMQNFNRAVGN